MSRLYVGASASDEEQAQELIGAALGLIERTPSSPGFRTGKLEITNAANGASVRASCRCLCDGQSGMDDHAGRGRELAGDP